MQGAAGDGTVSHHWQPGGQDLQKPPLLAYFLCMSSEALLSWSLHVFRSSPFMVLSLEFALSHAATVFLRFFGELPIWGAWAKAASISPSDLVI